MSSSEIYEVSELLDIKHQEGGIYVLIRWKGYTLEENSWEPWRNVNMRSLPELLSDLKARLPKKRKLIRLLNSIIIDSEIERRLVRKTKPSKRSTVLKNKKTDNIALFLKKQLTRTRGSLTTSCMLSSASCFSLKNSQKSIDANLHNIAENELFSRECLRSSSSFVGLQSFVDQFGERNFRCKFIENGQSVMRAMDKIFYERPREAFNHLKVKLAHLFQADRIYRQQVQSLLDLDVS